MDPALMRENLRTALELVDVTEPMLRRRLRREHLELADEAMKSASLLGTGSGLARSWVMRKA